MVLWLYNLEFIKCYIISTKKKNSYSVLHTLTTAALYLEVNFKHTFSRKYNIKNRV